MSRTAIPVLESQEDEAASTPPPPSSLPHKTNKSTNQNKVKSKVLFSSHKAHEASASTRFL